MGETKIQWTGKTWNPIRARNKVTGDVGWFCEHVSKGCRNCYAEKMNINTYFGNGLDYKPQSLEHLELFLDERILEQPLHWRKPTKVFPCSMTDAFARFVPNDWIDQMLAVAAETERHTYQFLTKRADRARQYFTDGSLEDRLTNIWQTRGTDRDTWNLMLPLKNVWLGVSVEDQPTADERIPLLLQTPAAVRWISAEPLLGPVDLANLNGSTLNALDGIDFENIGDIRDAGILSKSEIPALDWVVVGGESGSRAREFDVAWARAIIKQCKSANVAVFVKQLGVVVTVPHDNGVNVTSLNLKDKKGGDINEWPMDLRVREFPVVV